MIERPERYTADFARAGGDLLILHQGGDAQPAGRSSRSGSWGNRWEWGSTRRRRSGRSREVLEASISCC